MANKTQVTPVDPADFIAAVPDAARRADAEALSLLFGQATGEPAAMWGPSIVGFGRYRYRYDSGREGEAPLVGFSPRKGNLVMYLGSGEGFDPDVMARLGKHKAGVGCVYVNRLSDVDLEVLRDLAAEGAARRRAMDVG